MRIVSGFREGCRGGSRRATTQKKKTSISTLEKKKMDIDVVTKNIFVPNENRWVAISLPRLRCLEKDLDPPAPEPVKVLAWRPPPRIIPKTTREAYVPKASRKERGPNELTPREKQMLELHLTGLTSAQISDITGLTSSRIRKLIRSAKKISQMPL